VISDYLQNRGIQTANSSHHHVRSGWVGFDCPGCSPGWGKFRAGIELSTGRTNCWHCGLLQGRKVLVDLLGIPYSEACRVWAQEFKNQHLFVPDAEDEKLGTLELPKGIVDLMTIHKQYLKKRGFDPGILSKLWGIRGIGMAVKLSWRIFIPIHDDRGRVVSWTTRALHNDGTRYQSASNDQEEKNLKTLLYGEHLARNTIVIVEGPMDAWAIGPGGVATLGIAYTQTQLCRLSQYTQRIVCFDATEDAQDRADALCAQLAAFPGLTENVMLETGDDPADADPAEIAELRARYLEF